MLIARTEGEYLNNAYLIADRPQGHGVLIDPNGDVEPLLARAAGANITISHVVATHEHFDHVVDIEPLAARLGATVVAPASVAELVPGTTHPLRDGQHLHVGDLDFRAIDVPGHSPGQMALLVDGSHCLTADALFADTVGAQWDPGQPAFDEVRSSVMDRLLNLPRDTVLLPGHSRETTVADEWDHNPFVQVWRGLAAEGDEPCLVGQPFGWEARLIFRGPDYDGGTKAWVRFARGGDLLVAGSQVRPAPYPMAVSTFF